MSQQHTFRLVVYFKKPGEMPRTHNFRTLAEARVDAIRNQHKPGVFKVELLVVLESFETTDIR